MECKVTFSEIDDNGNMVEIDTLWNVKSTHAHDIGLWDSVEIDTLWNVKEDVNLYLNLIVS